MDTEMIINSAKDMILTYGPRLVAAVLVLIIGLWVVKGISRAVKSTMKRKEVDPSLQPFLTGLIGSLLKHNSNFPKESCISTMLHWGHHPYP